MKRKLAMSFRTRLILLVTGMLVIAGFITTVLLGWSTRRAVLEEAEATGEMVARLLARSAGLAQEIPSDVEQAIGDQMVALGPRDDELVLIPITTAQRWITGNDGVTRKLEFQQQMFWDGR